MPSRRYILTTALVVGLAATAITASFAGSAASHAMNVVISAPDRAPIRITLADNAAARDFHALLPLTVRLEDYAGKEKIAHDLPRKLNIAGAPASHAGKRGELTYYAPWGNLALFYRDHGGPAAGLVYLGTVTSGIEALETLEGSVRIHAD